MDAQQLQQLQALLTEFYACPPGGRRSQLEVQLQAARQQAYGWQLARQCMTQSENELILWFSSSVLEQQLKSQSWASLQPKERGEVTYSLLQRLFNVAERISPVSARAWGRCLVLLAMEEWPAEQAFLIEASKSALGSADTRLGGLYVLQQIANEAAPTVRRLPSRRDGDVQCFLDAQLPVIVLSLAKLVAHEMDAAAPGQPLPPHVSLRCSVAIDGILHYLEWANLDQVLAPEVVEVLFRVISSQENDLSTAAFSCLNQVLARHFIPPQMQDFLLAMFREVMRQLEHRLHTGLAHLEEDFVSKFTEFTLLFVSKHLRRSQSNPNFPMEAFFGLLQRYTFGQPSLEGFMACLEIYDALLDIMEDMEDGYCDDASKRAMTTYKAALKPFIVQLMVSSQFRHNRQMLSSMDRDDFSSFRRMCLAVVSKTFFLMPDELETAMCAEFSEAMNTLQANLADQPTPESARDLAFILPCLALLVTPDTSAAVKECLTQVLALADYLLTHGMVSTREELLSGCLACLAAAHHLVDENHSTIPPDSVAAKLAQLAARTLDFPQAPDAVTAALRVLQCLAGKVALVQLPIIQELVQSCGQLCAKLPPEQQQQLYSTLVRSIVAADRHDASNTALQLLFQQLLAMMNSEEGASKALAIMEAIFVGVSDVGPKVAEQLLPHTAPVLARLAQGIQSTTSRKLLESSSAFLLPLLENFSSFLPLHDIYVLFDSLMKAFAGMEDKRSGDSAPVYRLVAAVLLRTASQLGLKVSLDAILLGGEGEAGDEEVITASLSAIAAAVEWHESLYRRCREDIRKAFDTVVRHEKNPQVYRHCLSRLIHLRQKELSPVPPEELLKTLLLTAIREEHSLAEEEIFKLAVLSTSRTSREQPISAADFLQQPVVAVFAELGIPQEHYAALMEPAHSITHQTDVVLALRKMVQDCRWFMRTCDKR